MTSGFETEGGGDRVDGAPVEGIHRDPAERGRGDRGRPMAHPRGTAAGFGRRPRADERRHGADERRPLLERIGMAAIAAVLGLLFAAVAVAAYVGGELFLAVMAGIGSLMTLWVGALTLVRG